MKKFKLGLFGRILIAIVVGVALGTLFSHCGAAGDVMVRIFKTVNMLFAQLLKFIVPLLILGLVTPAIADVGKGAGAMLVAVMVMSYCSTVCAGFFGHACAGALLPHYVQEGLVANVGNGKEFLPYIKLTLPPLCDVLTALALSFMVGVGIIVTGAKALKGAADEFSEIVRLTIMKVIIPGLPLYIMTMICEMTAAGKFAACAGTMLKVIATGIGLSIAYLIILYTIAGMVSRRNPFTCLWRMLPAYMTGLSLASSSAVIPITLQCCEKNGLSKDIRNFVVPLCANVHMVGSVIKLVTSVYAIVIIYGLDIPFAQTANFIFMVGVAAVAAPGVMGGVLMASVGLLESILGLQPEHTALMMTFYLALDGYGAAANVTGDAAIAMIADRFFGAGKKGREVAGERS